MSARKIDFIYDDECQNVAVARANLREALAVVDLEPRWAEHRIGDPDLPARVRGFGSPTILVNGRDVAGAGPSAEACCRIYGRSGVPPVGLIVTALEKAENDSSRCPVSPAGPGAVE